MKRLFVASARLGIKAVQIIAYQPLIEALQDAERVTGRFFNVVTIVENFREDLERVVGARA
jgi:hypothetical protein